MSALSLNVSPKSQDANNTRRSKLRRKKSSRHTHGTDHRAAFPFVPFATTTADAASDATGSVVAGAGAGGGGANEWTISRSISWARAGFAMSARKAGCLRRVRALSE